MISASAGPGLGVQNLVADLVMAQEGLGRFLDSRKLLNGEVDWLASAKRYRWIAMNVPRPRGYPGSSVSQIWKRYCSEDRRTWKELRGIGRA